MGTNRPNGSLYIDIQGSIAKVEFGHPAGNSFVLELLHRLENGLKEIGKNSDVHAILLQSEGERAFCGGASFEELRAIETPEQGTKFFSGFAGVINAIRNCPQVVIGRVQGKAVGGGVGLAAACDFVMATEAASVKLSELSIGIAPLVIEPAVTRKIGPAGFAELSLQPTLWKNAYWAKEKGLYNIVFDNLSELDKELEHFMAQLNSHSPDAVRAIKKALWIGTSHWAELLPERAKMSGELALLKDTKDRLAKLSK